MRNLALSLMVVFVALSVAGCAATTSQSVPIPDQSRIIENPQMGRIYVIRPSAFGGFDSISMWIRDDNEYIGTTGGSGFLCWERPPGKTEISGIAKNISSVTLDVKAGEVYYIHQDIYGPGGPRWYSLVYNKLEVIIPEKAKELMKKCKHPVFRK